MRMRSNLTLKPCVLPHIDIRIYFFGLQFALGWCTSDEKAPETNFPEGSRDKYSWSHSDSVLGIARC